MPVYINQPDALDLMTKVEGEDWRRQQAEGRFSGCSFQEFLDAWTKIDQGATPERHADQYWQEREVVLYPSPVCTIYGWGGWNRYLVKFTGEIVFLRYLAWGPDAIQKAEVAGFRVWPEEDKENPQ